MYQMQRGEWAPNHIFAMDASNIVCRWMLHVRAIVIDYPKGDVISLNFDE